MAKTFNAIDNSLAEFITSQQMFFVATAPLAKDGHVNLSPKGLDSLRILDQQTVAYADLCGSGIETIAHIKENGRIVLMFCSFGRGPKIVRLHGTGEVIQPGHADFDALRSEFPALEGLRGFIRISCNRISDSCGWGVPMFDYVGQRSQLFDWAAQKDAEDLIEYQRTKNATSIDGLPGACVDAQ